MPTSETEEQRLVNSHLRKAMRKAVTLARNSIRTNSSDPEDWRADMLEEAAKFDFECGDCAALAVALHRSHGLPMFAVVDYDAVLKNNVLVHAYVKIEHAEYPVFDIRGPGNLAFVMDRFPNSGNAAEIAIDEEKLLAMAHMPSNMPDIEAVMPFARELLDEWEEDFGQASKPNREKKYGAGLAP